MLKVLAVVLQVRWWTQGGWCKRLVHLLPLALVLAAPLLIEPETGLGSVAMDILLKVGVFVILALGLNVVVGYLGLLELGYVTFMATGALIATLGMMTVKTETGWVLPAHTDYLPQGEFMFDFPGGYLVLILIAGLSCGILGVLRGIPTLRLTGDYYAIVTLGLAEIFYLIYRNEAWLSGGANGLRLSHPANDLTPKLFGETLYYDNWMLYYLVVVIIFLTIFAMFRLQQSRIGRAWAAIRIDETAARACGINVAWSKIIGFGISGFFGGVGGALLCVTSSTLSVNELDVWQSIIVLCAVVLGGMGSIRGVLLGTVILISVGEFLRQDIGGVRVPPEARYLVYGLLLLLLMRFRPQGLIPRAPAGHPPSAEEEEEMRRRQTPLYVLGEKP